MKRTFCIGSEWLYYKIYTGVRTSDIILVERLYPLIKELIQSGFVEKWFFIRYRDPDEHIRIRLRCVDNQSFVHTVNTMFPILDELLDSGMSWKIMTDTYRREIERYGTETIVASESLFYFDSEMIMKYLDLRNDFKTDELQLLFSFAAIDNLLNCFKTGISEKLDLMNDLQKASKQEFGAGKLLKMDLDMNYRRLANQISAFLDTSEGGQNGLFQIIASAGTGISAIVPGIMTKINIPVKDYLSSLIHMMINRQYTSRQRAYECIIYDHLFRYYKTCKFKDENKDK